MADQYRDTRFQTTRNQRRLKQLNDLQTRREAWLWIQENLTGQNDEFLTSATADQIINADDLLREIFGFSLLYIDPQGQNKIVEVRLATAEKLAQEEAALRELQAEQKPSLPMAERYQRAAAAREELSPAEPLPGEVAKLKRINWGEKSGRRAA